jgi:hypothetical protein
MLKQFTIALGVAGFVCLCCLGGCTRSETKSEAPSNVANATGAPKVNPANNGGTAGSSGAAAAVPKEGAESRQGQDEEVRDELHTPPKGSPERQAIMDTLRGRNSDVVFVVNYLMVHNGWAWADVSPVENGRTAEGGPSLLHMQNGQWKVMNLSNIPQNPDDPLEDMSVTPEYIRKVRKAFPKAPADIFPTAH